MMARIGLLLILVSLSFLNGAKALVVEELDGSPQILDVSRILVNGITLTDLGSKKIKLQSSTLGTVTRVKNGDNLTTISNQTTIPSIVVNKSIIYNGSIANGDISQYGTQIGWSTERNGGTLRSIQFSGDNGVTFNVSSISGNGGLLRTTFNSSLYQASNGNLTTWSNKAAPAGVVVGTTDTQTLTNKTIRNGTYNGSLLINGTTFSMPAMTQGDILFAKSTSIVKPLAKGTNHYTLKTNGNTLAWESLTTGTVTQVSNADTLLSIANKTTTPTITMNGALVSWSTKARPSGTVVGTSDVQTLTAKTLSGPILTTAISTNTSLQGPLLINGVNLSVSTMTQGSILYTKQANVLSALDNGASSNHKYLKVNGNTLVWETAPAGSGTSTGTNTGDQTITLTGNVTGSGTGSFAATIAANVVTSAMISNATIATADIAANAITSALINNATIAAADFSVGAVTSAVILNGTIATADIAANAITSALINNATLAAADFSVGAVVSAAILNGTLATADFAANSVTSALISNATIATADIAANAITSALISNATIAAADLSIGAVTSAVILNGTIANADFAANSITSNKISNGTIALADYSNGSIDSTKVAANAITSALISNATIATADLAANLITSAKISNGTLALADYSNGSIDQTKLAAMTSSQFSGVLSDEVGTGKFLLNGTPLMSSATLNKVTTFNGNTMSIGTLSQGSILFAKISGTLAALDNGASSNHKFLKVNGNALVWESFAAGTGTVTNVTNGDTMLTITNKTTTPSIIITANTLTSAKILNGTIATADIAANIISATTYITNGAVAAVDLASADFGDFTVSSGTATIDANTITSAKISNGVVATADIAANAITSALISNATLAAADFSVGAVTSAVILNGTIATADIAANAITSALINNATLAAADFSVGAVTSAIILNGTIANADFSANSITSNKISNGTLALADYSNGSIDSTKMAAFTSAQWSSIISDETGSSKLVFNGSPSINSPTLVSATLNRVITLNGNTMSIPSLTQGDILFSKIAGSLVNLAKGTNHYFLVTNGNKLAYENALLAPIINKNMVLNGSTLSLPTAVQGDILFSKVAGGYKPLAKGTNHYGLKVNGNTLAWEALTSAGGSTNIDGLSDAKSNTVNVYLGNGAGAVDTGSSFSTAIGIQSMAANVSASGLNNTAVGYNSLAGNTTGDHNVALGSQALASNTQGLRNAALGYLALTNNKTGTSNIAAGHGSLSNSNGDNNIAIGYLSGDNITQGSNNIVIGHDIDNPSISGTGQMTIANLIFGNGNTATGTTISSGKVGIRKANPAFTLDVNGTTFSKILSINGSTVTTSAATFLATSSSANLISAVTDEVGTGRLVFNGTPLMTSATLNKVTTLNGTALSIGAIGQGSLLFGKLSSTLRELTKGTNHYGLKVNGNTLAWEALAAGGASPWSTSGTSVILGTPTNNVSIGKTDTNGKLMINGDIGFKSIAAPTVGLQSYSRLYVNSTTNNLTFLKAGSMGSTSYDLMNPTAVKGPGTVTDTRIAVFNGTTGNAIKQTPVAIGISGDITGAASLTISGGMSSILTCSTNALVVTTGGLTGVGTASPTKKFQVTGESKFTDTMYLANNKFINWTDSSTNNAGVLGIDSTNKFIIKSNLANALMGGTNGDVGVRTLNTTRDTLTVYRTGKVGVDRPTPSYLLDVNGSLFAKNLNINGSTLSLTQGAVLYSKVAGAASTLAKGTNHYRLAVNGNALAWEQTPTGSGTVSGANTGDQTITLTGNVTGSGTGSFAATIAANAVTSAMINNATIATADIASSITLTTPVIGAATGTSLVLSGRMIAGTNINGTTANVSKVLSSGSVNGTTFIPSNGESMLSLVNIGNGGSAKTLDFKRGNFIYMQLNGTTCAIKLAKPNGPTRGVLALKQFAGGKLATWNADIAWPVATAPTLSTTTGYIDFVTCVHMGSTVLSNKWNCQATIDLR